MERPTLVDQKPARGFQPSTTAMHLGVLDTVESVAARCGFVVTNFAVKVARDGSATYHVGINHPGLERWAGCGFVGTMTVLLQFFFDLARTRATYEGL